MQVTFEKLQIKGFRSIGTCSINLESEGIISIKGVNNYEETTSSNGAGKSSIMEAINWCLFGKTSSGISDVENKYYNQGCLVILDFKIDDTGYSITRTLNDPKLKTTIILKKENDDISCRNKSDTDKLIKTILPFSQDIFLSTIFLSQGFSGRMSLLTPSARKERLEVLANIDEEINKFKNKISSKQEEITSNLSTITQELAKMQGALSVYTNEKNALESKLEQSKGISREDLDIPVDALSKKLEKLDSLIKENSSLLEESVITYEKLSMKSSELNKKKADIETRRNKYLEHQKMVTKKYCPTCNQEIKNKETSDRLAKEYKELLINLDDEEVALIQKGSIILSEMKKQKDLVSSYKEKKTSLQQMFNRVSNTLDTYYKNKDLYKDVQADIDKAKEYQEKIKVLNLKLQEISDKQAKVEIKVNVIKHIQQLITKDFRTYLLSDVVAFMNSKLNEYSKLLFSNDTNLIQISTDSSKLDIFLGDTFYENLSGGEKKKVDLALVLAQRDVALQLSGFQTNILICDEILENLDEQASNTVLNLLNTVSEEIDSLYIISHNNYSIPVDQTIVVTKGIDQVSTVTIV